MSIERELGLDGRETLDRLFYSTDDMSLQWQSCSIPWRTAKISDIWFTCLADKPMVRSYHLRNYNRTPLSQNLVQRWHSVDLAYNIRMFCISCIMPYIYIYIYICTYVNELTTNEPTNWDNKTLMEQYALKFELASDITRCSCVHEWTRTNIAYLHPSVHQSFHD